MNNLNSNIVNNNIVMELIPCEICTLPINFNDYIAHLETCDYRIQAVPNTQYNNIFNTINNIISEYNQENNSVSSLSNVQTSNNVNSNNPNVPVYNQRFFHTTFNPVIQRPNTTNVVSQPSLRALNPEEPTFVFHRAFGTPGTNFSPFDTIFRDILDQPLNSLFTNYNNTSDEFSEFNNLEDVVVGIENIDDVSIIIPYNEIADKEHECIACKETIESLYNNDNNTVFRKTLCNHIHCDVCLTTWLTQSKTCPTCRQCLETLFIERCSISSNNISFLNNSNINSTISFNTTHNINDQD